MRGGAPRQVPGSTATSSAAPAASSLTVSGRTTQVQHIPGWIGVTWAGCNCGKGTFHILVDPMEILFRKPVTGVGRAGDVCGMGSKVTSGEKSYKKRTDPISVNNLTLVDTAQPGTSLMII